jgi:hypothetical protein
MGHYMVRARRAWVAVMSEANRSSWCRQKDENVTSGSAADNQTRPPRWQALGSRQAPGAHSYPLIPHAALSRGPEGTRKRWIYVAPALRICALPARHTSRRAGSGRPTLRQSTPSIFSALKHHAVSSTAPGNIATPRGITHLGPVITPAPGK